MTMTDQQRRSVAKATGTIEDIQRDLQAMRNDVSRLTQEVTKYLTVSGSKALREVKAQMSPIEDAVRKRPFAAVAIAIGLGFLFAAIARPLADR